MSLGISFTGSGGKLLVGPVSGKAASRLEAIKAGDAGKFSAAINAKARDQGGKPPGSDERVNHNPATNSRLQLPDYSKSLTSANGNSNVPIADDSQGFIEAPPAHDELAGVHERATDKLSDTGFIGEIQGFNVPLASFGQGVTGTFSTLVKASTTAQNSQVEPSVDTVTSDASESADSVSAPGSERQEAANVRPEKNDHAEEAVSEPPKPAGTFNFGDDVVAKFLGGSANDRGNYSAGGFFA